MIEKLKAIRRYLKIGEMTKQISKTQILSSNEALKDFGKVWTDNKSDVMTMLALIEYEYIINNNYTKDDIAILKKTLGEVAKFFRSCGEEWEQYERMQAKKDN